jgi:hypothetical protein
MSVTRAFSDDCFCMRSKPVRGAGAPAGQFFFLAPARQTSLHLLCQIPAQCQPALTGLCARCAGAIGPGTATALKDFAGNPLPAKFPRKTPFAVRRVKVRGPLPGSPLPHYTLARRKTRIINVSAGRARKSRGSADSVCCRKASARAMARSATSNPPATSMK